jgi:hypothetical protein
VYRGDFDRESAVDVSIKGMASERMDYPLRYGYSLVRIWALRALMHGVL